MYKRLVFLTAFLAQFIFGTDGTIVDFDQSHAQAVKKIYEQNMHALCPDQAGEELLDIMREYCESLGAARVLVDPLDWSFRKVILAAGKVIGFIDCCKQREHSLEHLQQGARVRGISLQEDRILQLQPLMKRTAAECGEFAYIETLAILRRQQGKGCGRALLRAAMNEACSRWPELKRVKLQVSKSNVPARRLYESEGFIVSADQPLHVMVTGSVQYEKSLE